MAPTSYYIMCMKKVLVLLFLFTALLPLRAVADGRWRMYLAYHNNTYNVPMGTRIYSLCDGNLYSYDTADNSVHYFSKLDGLNGKSIRFIAAVPTRQRLLVVYTDGNTDLISPNGDVFNIPQLSSANGGDLVLNDLAINGDEVDLATNEGVVRLDMKKAELKGYYKLGANVASAVVFEGKLYAALSDKVLACDLNANMSDKNSWQVSLNASVRRFFAFGRRLLFQVSTPSVDYGQGLWSWATGSQPQKLSATDYPKAYVDASKAVFANDAQVIVLDVAHPDQIAQTIAANNTWRHLTLSGSTFWASEGLSGLRNYKVAGNTLQPAGVQLAGSGPKRDLCYYMKYYGDKLLIAGGRLDPYDRIHFPGTLMQYDGRDWRSFEEEDIAAKIGYPYTDINCVVQDPRDPTHHFATSAGKGLFEFKNFKFQKHYSLHNSPLRSAVRDGNAPYYVRLDGLNFDKAGNLFMVNNHADTVIRVLKADGGWAALYADGLSKAPTLEKTLIDTKGRLWVASRRTIDGHTAGLYCLDYNGTIDNTSDDISKYRTSGVNEDATAFDFGGVYTLMQDTDGSIWVGAGTGLYVITNPDDWFKSDFYITQIKVPRNDGTNYADYLLAKVPVNAITTDGGGRKWIGTLGGGLYLVSPDGTSILKHFTSKNSPLLSDNIYSLAVSEADGEVMIGTDVGLCSYFSNAARAQAELDKNNVKVYPNPVRPEFTGVLAVSGLTANADVRIVNTAGHVVAGGRSVGGTFTWDLRGTDGFRVPSGVYDIMVVTNEANKGIVAKVTII